MKLIQCHIENFGGLSGYDLEFDPGLTVLREENGFGKTTLAGFIRAMFYGLPKKNRKNAKNLGKRERYDPWNGGKYGGSLTFEQDGKLYRIQRSFGTVDKDDTFTLMDLQTGQESKAFSKAIGRELFGLDEESFERSTYLPQSRFDGPLSTDSIQAKLGGLVEDENDVGGYEKAMKSLDSKRKVYTSESKGTIAQANRKILETSRELEDARDCAGELRSVEGRMEDLKQELEDTDRQIGEVRKAFTAATEAAARLAHHQQLDRMVQDFRNTAGSLTDLKKQYPKGIPTGEELEAITDAVEKLSALSDGPITPADQDAQRYVEENAARFGDGVPTEEEMAGMRQICDEYRTLSAKRDACVFSPEEGAELERIRAFLTPGIPGAEELAGLERAAEEAERLRRESLRLAAVPGAPAQKKTAAPILLALGGAAVVAGIVLFILDLTAPGGIALGLGLVMLVAAVYMKLNRQTVTMDPRIQTIVQENDARASELEASIRAFTERYGGTLAQIREQAQRLPILEQRQQEQGSRRAELTEEMNTRNDSLRRFFDRYLPQGYTGGGYDLLSRIQRDRDAWERAQNQLGDLEARTALHQQRSREARQVLDRIWTTYALMPHNRDQALRLRDDARQMEHLEKDARLLAQQIRDYRAEHADILAEPLPENPGDPTRLRQEERELLEKQNELNKTLLERQQDRQRLSAAAEQIPQLEDQLAHWQKRKEEDEAREGILKDAMDFLTQAKTDLALSYMDPIRDGFAALMGRMAGEQREKILVTPDLTVRLERGGESRKLECFSAGQADLVMLCMRLALVDALFREAKPFVILDDPFVNLDDRHTAQALELIRELAKDRQILYLTCNSSRT